MQNIEAKVTGKVGARVLTLTIMLDAKTTPSASGKSQVIATTRGSVSIPGTEDKTSKVLAKLGLNLYR